MSFYLWHQHVCSRHCAQRPSLLSSPGVNVHRSVSLRLFFPVAGILYGTMTLELGGTVNITCEKTGYSATIEFKLKVGKCCE